MIQDIYIYIQYKDHISYKCAQPGTEAPPISVWRHDSPWIWWLRGWYKVTKWVQVISLQVPFVLKFFETSSNPIRLPSSKWFSKPVSWSINCFTNSSTSERKRSLSSRSIWDLGSARWPLVVARLVTTIGGLGWWCFNKNLSKFECSPPWPTARKKSSHQEEIHICRVQGYPLHS